MTSNRKEPTFSGVPHDDSPATRISAPSVDNGATRKRPSATSSVPVIKSSPLLPFAFLLAVTGLGLAGFTYWQLLMAQQQVSVAEKRLAILEDKLALSDDESTQSLATLQANLKESRESLELAHNEIRKLWDTRNVNKKAIADNDSKLDELTKTVKSASGAAAAAQKLAQEQLQNWKALSAEVSAQVEQIRVVSDLTENQQKRVRELVDSANKLESQLGVFRTDMLTRVKNNEEAIQSMDNYRRIVNRDLLQIKEQLTPTRP